MLNSFIKYPHLLFIWLFPIIVAASTGRLRVNYGIDYTIVYLLGASVGFGILYYFLYLFRISLSKNIILIILILFPMMLISDFSEYRGVAVLASYALVVHAISRKFPSILWDQYYIFCMILSWMAIIDIALYLIIDEVIFTYRERIDLIEHGFIVLPKVSPIFDEMSHQSFFIMPAAILAFQKNYKHFLLLSSGVLMTFSVQALLVFPFVFIYFNWRVIKSTSTNFSFFVLFSIIVTFIILNSFSFISSKFLPLLNPEWLLNREKGVSAMNLLLSFDYLRYANFYDLLVGFGFYGYDEGALKSIFKSSIFYDYYVRQGAFIELSMVGLINFLMQFGLIVSIIVVLLFYNAKKYALDKVLYSISIIIVFLSMMKNSHSVDYFVHLFFAFGLAWSLRKEKIKATNP